MDMSWRERSFPPQQLIAVPICFPVPNLCECLQPLVSSETWAGMGTCACPQGSRFLEGSAATVMVVGMLPGQPWGWGALPSLVDSLT